MRKRLVLLSVFFAALAGSDWGACRILSATLRRDFDAWAVNMRSHGWTVISGNERSGGFPLAATLTIPGFTIAGGRVGVPGSVAWHGERVVLSLGLLHPTLLSIAPQGDQTVRLSTLPQVVFAAENWAATVPLGAGRPGSIDLSASGIAGGLRSGRHQDVQIAGLDLHLELAQQGAARISASLAMHASMVGLPDNGRWPLGATIGHVSAAASLASPAISGEAPAEQARAWRDWGGILHVESLDVGWGPLGLKVQAALHLDGDLQPAGSGTAHVNGAAATLDALASGGSIEPGVAQTAKAVLSLMAPADGAALDLPFTVKDDTLSVGRIPLVQIRRLDWSRAF